ncbi:GroES-like protein [Mycena olivaceomarginata]|nr:GroES-like protein [Mycena olivaceomarginata]
MSVQQAIVVESPKAPFTLSSAKIPSPAKGEVLVKILSVALNPGNWKQREYDVVIDEYPAVLGCDVAGVVEKLGEGAEGFKKGDKVFAQILGGGFQQYTTVPAAVLMPIPENTSFDEVATFPIAFTTAAVGLFAAAPIGLGLKSQLLVGQTAPRGFFSQLPVIQLFKFLGFTRIIAYASKTHFDYLKQLGATEFVDRVEVPVASLAAHPALSPPVKVVYDVGNAPNEAYDCANRIEILPNGLVGILGGLERLQKGSVSGVKLVAHPQDPRGVDLRSLECWP